MNRFRQGAMIRLPKRALPWLLLSMLAAPDAGAQAPPARAPEAKPSPEWQACRTAPTRACVFAEAVSRIRDDAPLGRDPQFADWDRRLYLRMSEIAAAAKDRALFDEARRSAEANEDADARRSALRWVAASQARADLPDDAVRTLESGDDGGFAAEEIALAFARAGHGEAALAAVRRLSPADRQVRALTRLARATRQAAYLDPAMALIGTMEDGYAQSAARPPIAVTFAELGLADRALQVVRAIAVSYHRAQALAGMAAVTRDARLLVEARGYATGFDGRGHEDEVWAALAHAEIVLGVPDGARQTLQAHLAGEPSRALASVVGELAAVYWLRGDKPLAEKTIDALLGGSWTIGEARAVLARRLIAAGRVDDARQVSFLADEITFDNLSAEIALKQAATGAFADALATADSIQYPGRRSLTLAEIAVLLPP
jgi:hypothetical protein